MTEKKLRSLLDLWKTRLGLSDWRINLVIAPCEDETSYMEITRSIYYQRAKITVNPWMLDIKKVPKDVLIELNDNTIEESLVHELLHLYTRDLVSIVRNDLGELLHRDVHEIICNSISRADERCVDALSVALCQSFRK